jgi:uncharacterized membrane protein YagU involved in acid resistance
MSAASTTLSAGRSKAYRTILWGGLIAGVLDLTAALVTNGLRGIAPLRILQSIASGLLGSNSYRGGFSTAALGVGLHFIIATGAAAVYYAASRKLRFLVGQAIISGLLYGIAVYLFMNLVVLPLSAFPHRISFRPALLVTGLIVHMLCVGIPIALVVRHYSK